METPSDRFTYPGTVYSAAHIDRLASMAFLHGVDSPELKTCRVLELGCNRGLHLIGMALLYPEAQFVGVDVSEASIASASDLAEALELSNISFRAMDIAQLTGRPGECDYLIAHGLYSWVPDTTREKILEICGRVLADNGIALISFNTYPGWHLRQLVVEMMNLHTAGIEDPIEKLKQGAAFAGTVLRAVGEDSPVASLIQSEVESLLSKDPLVTYFDDFFAENTAVYFSEFMRRARLHGLQYVSEAEITRLSLESLPAEAGELIRGIEDVVTREQYVDFFRLTRFRHTLLCRDGVLLDRGNLAFRLTRMYIASSLQPSGPAEINSDADARFRTQTGGIITVNQPFVKAVVTELANAWPARISFAELLERASATVTPPQQDPAEMLNKVLFRMLNPNLLEIDIVPYPFPSEVTEKPVASKLARLQAANGSEVISMRHHVVDLDDPAARTVLRLLDGTRDRRQILESATLVGCELNFDQLEIILHRMLALSLLVA
jgi:SAM-dependent methyltransferase